MASRRGVWNCCCRHANRHTVYATTSSSTDCSSIGWWSILIPAVTTPPKFHGRRGLILWIHLAGAGKSAASPLLPYLILAVPIADMSAVILARLRHGKSPLSQTNAICITGYRLVCHKDWRFISFTLDAVGRKFSIGCRNT